MKELEAISINEGAVLTEHGLKANGEVILIYSEPVYHSGGEEAVKRRHTNCLQLAAVVMRKNFAAALSKTSASQPQEEG